MKCPKILEMLKEDDGTWSLSRVMVALTVDVVLGLLAYVVIKTVKFPDAATLAGIAAFTTSLVGTLYGLNQSKHIIAAIKGTNIQPLKDLVTGSDSKAE